MRPLAPDSPYRARTLERVNAAYAAHLDRGMELLGYPGETIQCRNELDRTNWLGLQDICRDAIAADLGDVPIPEPGIRCTSNRFIRPTYAETAYLMRQVRDYAMTSQAVWWGLKDAVKTASTLDALQAIEDGLGEAWR